MILHINLRPDGNGTAFYGTPEEIKKRFNDFKKSVERSGPRPNFHTMYEVSIWQVGSRYRICNNPYDGNWKVFSVSGVRMHTIKAYQTFGKAFNKMLELQEGER